MGFEPTRAEHNGLAVHRLNHSATSSSATVLFLAKFVFADFLGVFLFAHRQQYWSWFFRVSFGEQGCAGRALAAPVTAGQGDKQVFVVHLPLSLFPSVSMEWQRVTWHLLLPQKRAHQASPLHTHTQPVSRGFFHMIPHQLCKVIGKMGGVQTASNASLISQIA